MALEINCCFRHMGDTVLMLLPEKEIPMACALLEALQNGMLKSICLRTDELPEEPFGLQGRPVMCWPSTRDYLDWPVRSLFLTQGAMSYLRHSLLEGLVRQEGPRGLQVYLPLQGSQLDVCVVDG